MSGDTHPMTEASSVPVEAEGVSAEAAAVEGTDSPATGESLTGMDEAAAVDTPTNGDQSGPALEQRLAALQAENDSLRSQYMRIAADFDNFRKRQSREQEDLRQQITCSTLKEILPVVDNFDRARQQLNPQSEEAQTLHRSYQGLYKQLVDVFKQLGVSPMRVEGEPFDPSLHEAVMREPSEDHPEDVVVAELQRGYHLNGTVLRHALVKVSMGPGPSGDAEPLQEQGG